MKYKTPFERIFKASVYSLRGLYFALKKEQAFRYEFIILLIILLTGFLLKLSVVKFLVLTGAWLVVMCFELVNSAVERAFDLIDKNFRPEIMEGKDMLSSAVFISVCFNIILWGAFLFFI